MLNPIWRRCLRKLASRAYQRQERPNQHCRMRLEELESRLAPASFATFTACSNRARIPSPSAVSHPA